MRYRQIHLDFHTAPVIDDVGTQFDVKDFVKTLKEAHVNSINIFAKCHHGMCYYPTKIGVMHPSLKFDMMGRMIKELHANDIKCPLYFPIGWEEEAANHTEWLEMGKSGVPGHKLPDDNSYYSWRKLCLNNPGYKEYIKRQLAEIMENYEVDGFWFDIIFQQKCICSECVSEMHKMGLNPENEKDVLKHDELTLSKFQNEINDYINKSGRNIPTVYNSSWAPHNGSGDIMLDNRSLNQDHLEIESLPSGEWGYNHFPMLVNYHNRNNAEVIGMNGKFHISWGDHGSLKNNEALEYECYRMIANGCACSVGDQLHPRGLMNKAAYERIGRVYKQIEEVEDYCIESRKVYDIGIVVSNDFYERNSASDEGAMRMLMELHYTFDFIPKTDALNKYKLIILPDNINIDTEFSNKLKDYISAGGKVLATYKSADKASLGIEYIKDSDYEPAYMVIKEGLIKDVEALEYVCYLRGGYVSSKLPVKAYVGNPYFNRTPDCFSSHRHFPFDKESDYPAILLSDNIGYSSFPLFADYIINGNRIYRDVIKYLIESLLLKPVVRTDAPTCAEITVRRKEDKLYVHIISYISERRTKTIDLVDTKLPVYNVKVEILAEGKYSKARAVRSGTELKAVISDNGYIEVTVPCIDGYEIIEIS